MALTAEQQSQVDVQNATDDHRSANQIAGQADQQAKLTKIEAMRMAKDVLVENRRVSAAADATAITDSDIVTFAATLVTFVNS